MASRDVKVLIKTLSDMSGLTRLGKFLHDHSGTVKALSATYDKLKAASAAAIRVAGDIASAQLRTARNAALGLAGGIAMSVREFSSFNVAMARAWTMMPVGIGRFREMRSAIVDLSAKYGLAKQELAGGLYQALSAGVDQKDALAFLETAAKVAVTDGSDVATSIDGISTVINAFGKKASDATAIADLMFQTVASGKTTFAQLAGSISQAAAPAAALGIPIEQLLSSVVTLTKNGVPTATAMNQIRNAMLALSGELGDGWAKTMRFQDALQLVAQKAQYSETALEKIFGRETLPAVLAMVGNNAASAAADLANMGNSAGALNSAFGKTASETLHWPNAFQTVRAILSDIGQSLDTKLRPVVSYITDKLNALRTSDLFKNFADSFSGKLVGVIDQIVAAITTAAQFVQELRSKGLGLAESFGPLKEQLLALGEFLGTALLEYLRANIAVFQAIAKAVFSVFKQEILSLNLPGMQGAREAAASKAYNQMSESDAAEFLRANSEMSDPVIERLGKQQSLKRYVLENYGAHGNIEGQAALGSFTSPQEFSNAFSEAQTSLQGSRDRLGAKWTSTMGTVTNAANAATPGIDWSQRNAANLAAVQSARPAATPLQTPAVSPETLAAMSAAEASRKAADARLQAYFKSAALDAETLNRQMREMEARDRNTTGLS